MENEIQTDKPAITDERITIGPASISADEDDNPFKLPENWMAALGHAIMLVGARFVMIITLSLCVLLLGLFLQGKLTNPLFAGAFLISAGSCLASLLAQWAIKRQKG